MFGTRNTSYESDHHDTLTYGNELNDYLSMHLCNVICHVGTYERKLNLCLRIT
jgi:hypothetical protein